MSTATRVSRADYQRTLHRAADLVRKADTNGDGSVGHFELLDSAAYRKAPRAAQDAAERLFVLASNTGSTRGATEEKLASAVRSVSSKTFLDTFDSQGDGFSKSEIRRMRNARRDDTTDAGDVGAAVAVWAQHLASSRR